MKDPAKALQCYSEAAEKQVAYGQNLLGDCHREGKLGLSVNFQKAFKLYKKAMKQGHVGALYNLGWCFENGLGVEKNLYKAVDCYFAAGKLGLLEAQWRVGVFHREGLGVEKNLLTAFEWLERAAKSGHTQSQYAVAQCFHKGIGVGEDKKKRIEWLKKAANNGLAEAQADLALHYLNKYYGNRESVAYLLKSYNWFLEAAKQGYLDNDVYTNNCLAYSSINYDKFYRHYHGIGSISKMYENVLNKKRITSAALKDSAEKGSALEKGLFAMFLRTSGEEERANDWFEMAAKEGDARSLYFFYNYTDGYSILENTQCLFMATEKGYFRALDNLRMLFHFNLKGIESDDISQDQRNRKDAIQDLLKSRQERTKQFISFAQESFSDLFPSLIESFLQAVTVMQDLFSLLEKEVFAINCILPNNWTYTTGLFDEKKRWFSFLPEDQSPSFKKFKESYPTWKDNALVRIRQMKELKKTVKKILLVIKDSDTNEFLKFHILEMTKINAQRGNFLSAVFKSFLKASDQPARDDCLNKIRTFVKHLATHIEDQEAIFIYCRVPNENNVLKTHPKDFYGVFDDLVKETLPYRNHLFVNKYPKLVKYLENSL